MEGFAGFVACVFLLVMWLQVPATKANPDPGCFFKLPTGCPRHKNRKAFSLLRDPDRSSQTNQDRCDQRKEAWDKYCGVNNTETFYRALPKQAIEPQNITVEILANRSATYWLNGKQVWSGAFDASAGKIGFGQSCVDAKVLLPAVSTVASHVFVCSCCK